MRTIAKTGATRGSLLTDPQARGWLFQIIAVVTVVGIGWFLFHNTQTNLAHRGITSGFGFLNNAAGFGISQHLIDYSESDSYGRVFWVGLLNTLLVSVIGIILATIIGFILGVTRLSPNWLIRQIATVYIETFRNIPPLLQIFFVYFAVLSPLPGPRDSLSLWDIVFFNNRGVQMPSPSAGEGFWPFWIALFVALVAIVMLNRWARARRHATGQMFPVFWSSLALRRAIPLGDPRTAAVQHPWRLGGDTRIGVDSAGAFDLYRRLHWRDRPRRHPVSQPRADRSCGIAGTSSGTRVALGHHPSGDAGDHSAAD
jgi:general L-amino acid transport system permease protein